MAKRKGRLMRRIMIQWVGCAKIASSESRTRGFASITEASEKAVRAAPNGSLFKASRLSRATVAWGVATSVGAPI